MRAARHRGRAGAAFAAGLALGAAAVFAALAALGAAVSGRAVLYAAVAIGAAAVVSDALGLRVRPQVRLQVPEPWRRTMPLGRALFLYGLLLGTGLTTYVPATAAWALPALCLALGSLGAALAIAAGFAAGRALPVLVLAARGGETALDERPAGLRLLRALAAVSLLCALVAGRVEAAGTVASPAGDPSATGTDLAWQQPGVGGFLRRADGTTTQLPGTDPAVGATYVAWRSGPTVTVADRATLAPVLSESLPGVQKLAVSRRWLAYRTPTEIRVEDVTAPGTPKQVVRVSQPATLGRPALGVDLVAFHRASRDGSWLTAVNVVSGTRLQLRFSRDDQLLNPSLLNGQLLYVRSSRCWQRLLLGRARGGRDRVLYEIGPLAGQDLGHEQGHTRQGERVPCAHRPRPTAKMLWTTALSPTTAFVTVLKPTRGGRTVPTLLAVSRMKRGQAAPFG
ncbi:MAG TPA: hypothetical protein VLA98_09395 [Solirubrobacteraceae bacterium]|nr:hypothetical protein [Solirubrobacteraceae bacterium]